MCRYSKWKRYETHSVKSRYKTGARTYISNEIFDIDFRTRIMTTELNKGKQVVQMRNTSLLIDLKCYIIIGVIIIIINDGEDSGGGSSSVIN